jgi:hypothetical protein
MFATAVVLASVLEALTWCLPPGEGGSTNAALKAPLASAVMPDTTGPPLKARAMSGSPARKPEPETLMVVPGIPLTGEVVSPAPMAKVSPWTLVAAEREPDAAMV